MNKLISFLNKKYPDALFIITGDHYSRASKDNSNPLHNVQIPFILWGPNIIPESETKRKNDWYGTHTDIFPTLMGLISDEPIAHHLFGNPMWQKNRRFHGAHCVGDSEHIFLNEKKKLYNYKTSKFVENPSLRLSLLKWWGASKAVAFKILYGTDTWDD